MALADQAGRKAGASITLSKNLPVASGIGGGSADAAATLRILNRFWQVGLDGPTLSRLGQSLGADVPVCLFGQTARVQGIGEKIEPGPALPDIGLLLWAYPPRRCFLKGEGPFPRQRTCRHRLTPLSPWLNSYRIVTMIFWPQRGNSRLKSTWFWPILFNSRTACLRRCRAVARPVLVFLPMVRPLMPPRRPFRWHGRVGGWRRVSS